MLIVMKIKTNKSKWHPESEEYWDISHSINKDDSSKIGWNKYREDELIDLTQGEMDLLSSIEKS